jgi:T-complex protein 1 subunit beta
VSCPCFCHICTCVCLFAFSFSSVFISRQLIYNYPEQLFTEAGVTSIEHADFEGVERLALVLGAEIASTFDHPELCKIGHCKLIEEIVIGEDKVIRFSGVEKGEACSVILRGASQQILDEAERSLHDALCVLVQTTQVSVLMKTLIKSKREKSHSNTQHF